ncbi:MAG: hypothetical protein A3D52_02350 [Candidatus Taylorbacteria bacterium RIFCSPHIGHO2_02_FULL_44_36]|nr:MAG: hypothetical protein A3D52_02350 [Candidatus Taylorbacteria bacterium RIFCSPHIGHO2_02_FULL_44_36]
MKTQCLCIWCNKPFDTELEEYVNGHTVCGNNREQEINRRSVEELVQRCPPETSFNLIGGTACD